MLSVHWYEAQNVAYQSRLVLMEVAGVACAVVHHATAATIVLPNTPPRPPAL